MQRFFFHIEHGETSQDLEDTLLSGPDEARTACAALLGEILRESPAGFWVKPSIAVSVEDEAGEVLWKIDALGSARPAALRVQGGAA